MQADLAMRANEAAPISNAAQWAGRVMSALVVLFLIFDAALKLIPLQVVIDSMNELGYPPTVGLARGIGVVTAVCVVLYAWPRTAVLGAILMTGLYGGAIATHLRIGSPIFTHLLFGVYLGLLAWGGLWLRDPRLRAMIPFRL
jgi:DoxX-like family